MPILMLYIITQVGSYGQNSLQMTYLLVDMVNQLICNTLASPFYLLFNLLGRDSGSFEIFPHNIQTWGGLGSSLPCSIPFNLSLVTT